MEDEVQEATPQTQEEEYFLSNDHELPTTPEELAKLLDQARTGTLALVRDAVIHYALNPFARVKGFTELAATRREVPESLLSLLKEANNGVADTDKVFQKIAGLNKIVTKNEGGRILLDLDASTNTKTTNR